MFLLMVHLLNISVQFGGRYLFEAASLHVRRGDRIGLVGPNGAGKTTLLKIMAGLERPEAGEIRRAKLLTVGYLPQESVAQRGRSLVEEARSAYSELIEAEKEMDRLREQLASGSADDPNHARMLTRLGELQSRFEQFDGFSLESRVEQVLSGLGFSKKDFQRCVETFSGGWQMRIALAKLLLRQPSLLLLDEPTNHLDLDSLRWVESFLDAYPGALVIVSHDRAFLDKLVRRIVEINHGRLQTYAGNYSDYEQQKALRLAQQRAALKAQQRKIRQTEAFIDRFRYKATKARQVQSRLKQLDKMRVVEVEEDGKPLRFRFPPGPRSGRLVVELRQVSKSYGDKEVLRDVDLTLQRGERVAVVGVNGAGKSTLARIVAGLEPLTAGQRLVSANLVTSYFAQQQTDNLDPALTVLETLETVAPDEMRPRLRSLLGSFLFSGDDVQKKVSVLSGGEKSRLVLAKMLLLPANLLVLDEPTNHLDIASKEVLRRALADFDGAMLIVSHDRAFLDGLVERVVEVRDGRVRSFPGDLHAYLSYREKEASEVEEQGRREAPLRRRAAAVSRKEEKRRQAEERQKRYRVLRPLQEQVAAVEEQIEQAEQRKEDLERELADPALYEHPERARATSWDYKRVEERLSELLAKWEQLVEELERVQAELAGSSSNDG